MRHTSGAISPPSVFLVDLVTEKMKFEQACVLFFFKKRRSQSCFLILIIVWNCSIAIYRVQGGRYYLIRSMEWFLPRRNKCAITVFPWRDYDQAVSSPSLSTPALRHSSKVPHTLLRKSWRAIQPFWGKKCCDTSVQGTQIRVWWLFTLAFCRPAWPHRRGVVSRMVPRPVQYHNGARLDAKISWYCKSKVEQCFCFALPALVYTRSLEILKQGQ